MQTVRMPPSAAPLRWVPIGGAYHGSAYYYSSSYALIDCCLFCLAIAIAVYAVWVSVLYNATNPDFPLTLDSWVTPAMRVANAVDQPSGKGAGLGNWTHVKRSATFGS